MLGNGWLTTADCNAGSGYNWAIVNCRWHQNAADCCWQVINLSCFSLSCISLVTSLRLLSSNFYTCYTFYAFNALCFQRVHLCVCVCMRAYVTMYVRACPAEAFLASLPYTSNLVLFWQFFVCVSFISPAVQSIWAMIVWRLTGKNWSMLCCVWQLCTMIRTQMWPI